MSIKARGTINLFEPMNPIEQEILIYHADKGYGDLFIDEHGLYYSGNLYRYYEILAQLTNRDRDEIRNIAIKHPVNNNRGGLDPSLRDEGE